MNKLQLSTFGIISIPLVIASFQFGKSQSEKQFETRVNDAFINNPNILLNVIQNNPAKVMTALQDATHTSRKLLAQKRHEEKMKELEKFFLKPLSPTLSKHESFRGAADAPLTIINFVDFESVFSAYGASTIKKLSKLFPGKIKVYYKHNPRNYHSQGNLAARYYESILKQDKNKAFQFLDIIFENQKEVNESSSYFDKIAKSLNLDMKKLNRDLNSNLIIKKIRKDKKEASQYNFTGTPAFIVAGIPIEGAYPASFFVNLIKKLEDKSRITL